MKRLLVMVLALCAITATTMTPATAAEKKVKAAKTPKASAKAKEKANENSAVKSESAADAALAAIDAQIESAKLDKTKEGWRTRLPRPTAVTFDASKDYVATITTNKGPITIKLLPQAAPLHVTNFIYLARMGFYDGLAFHRVIPGFMAQGGDPLGNGTGGPGYDFGGEVDPNTMTFSKAGLLSNANRGPNTDGSQFFVTFAPTPWLKGNFCVFGEVQGSQVAMVGLEKQGSQSGQTTEPLSMSKVTIEARAKATK